MEIQSSLMTENLSRLFQGFAETAPKLLGALALVVIGLILASLISNIVRKLLVRIGADKLAAKVNDIELISKSSFHFKLSNFVGKLIYYFVLIIFVVAASDVLGMPAISNLFNDILNWIPNFLVAIVILILGLLFSEFVRKAVYTTCESLGIPSSRMISLLAFYFLFLNIVISALAQAKVDTSFISNNISIIIGAAAFAFAIGYGLASRHVVANFLASYYTKSKFVVGDKIQIGEEVGTIIDMDRSTLTLSSEHGKTIIPLNLLSSEKVRIIED